MLLFQIQFLYDMNFLFLSFKVLQRFIIWHSSYICHTQYYLSTLCKGLIRAKVILMFEDIMVPCY